VTPEERMKYLDLRVLLRYYVQTDVSPVVHKKLLDMENAVRSVVGRSRLLIEREMR
jgi:hypothetical protein